MHYDAKSTNDGCRRFLAVEWQDCEWEPRIEVRPPVAAPRRVPARQWRMLLNTRPPRSIFPSFKIMKTNLPHSRRSRAGFTLVELLVVIGIIATLAALLLPALGAAKTHAKKVQAQLEMSEIVTAVQAYDSAYGRFPVSAEAQSVASGNQGKGLLQNGDFTYGGTFPTPATTSYQVGTMINGSILSNADVIAILMDITNYPGTTFPTINTNCQKNPQQTLFLSAKMSGYNPSSGTAPLPGVGTDLVYRDPWGNPYVITMDLSYDDMCDDFFYDDPTYVSVGGLNGLISVQAADGKYDYAYRGKVMVWSAGPDGKIDPSSAANQGYNKDNVLSW